MQCKLRFSDACVMADTNTFALNTFRSMMVGRLSSAI